MSLPFQPWPSLPLAAEWPLGVLREFYVRTDGSDITGQGIPSRPYRTPERALRELQSFGRGIVHLGSGTYPRPLMNGIRGPVVLVGDGGGDPADDGLTEVEAVATAQAGTGAGVMVGAGYAPNAQRRNVIEVLTGAAAGQRRTITDNTATDLIPARNFEPAAAPGDTFRIVESAVFFDDFSDADIWIQNCGAAMRGFFSGIAGEPPTAALRNGVYLVNVRLAADAGTQTAAIVQSYVCGYGLHVEPSVDLYAFNSDLYSGVDTQSIGADQIAALLGLGSPTAYAGYALSRETTLRLISSAYTGFLGGDTGEMTLRENATATVRGGEQFNRFSIAGASFVLLFLFGAPRLRISRTGGGDAANLFGTGSNFSTVGAVELLVDSGDGVRVARGAEAALSASGTITSTTGNAVNASQGGRVFVEGAPAGNWSGGSADTRVSATETQAAAFYAAVDDTLAAAVANGSVITRVS